MEQPRTFDLLQQILSESDISEEYLKIWENSDLDSTTAHNSNNVEKSPNSGNHCNQVCCGQVCILYQSYPEKTSHLPIYMEQVCCLCSTMIQDLFNNLLNNIYERNNFPNYVSRFELMCLIFNLMLKK